ncbi:MAG: hypothetical protein V3U92_02445 [Cellulophaga sp.]
MKLTKKEHIAFTLGVILIGGFFGTTIFYYLPEFWKPAAVWDIKNAVIASVLLFLPIVISYPFTSKKRIWLFFALLLLAGYFVKDLQTFIGYTGNSLLESIQNSNNWVYLNYFLVPIVLTVVFHWACGFFSLSLLRFVSNLKNKHPISFNATFLSSGFAFLLLSFFAIGCMLVIKSGPIYATVSFLPSTRIEIRDFEIEKLKENWSSKDNIHEINTFMANTDIEHEFAQSVFQNILLLKIEPKSFALKGKHRTSLLNSLKGFGNPTMELSITDNSDRPQVPLRPSYSISELEYVLDKNDESTLSEIGVSTSEWNNAVATTLRLSTNGRTLESLRETKIYINDIILNIEVFGEFKTIHKEFDSVEFPASYWVSFSPDSEATSPSGVLILLDESKLLAIGLGLANVEAIISQYLDGQTAKIELSNLENLVIKERKDEAKVFLWDIALIERRRQIDTPQGEVNGEPYEIRIGENY